MFMLDTDTSSYVLKTKSEKLERKFKAEIGKISICEIVLAELRFGADNHQNKSQYIHELIDDFITRLDVIPWAASSTYGQLRANLQEAGTPIGNLDTLISAHALQQDLILATNNTKQFKRVPGLRIENWV